MTAAQPAGDTPPKVYIVLIKARLRRNQPWRWVARRGGNWRKLAISGESYTNRSDALSAIQTLFGHGTEVYLRQGPLGNVKIRSAR